MMRLGTSIGTWCRNECHCTVVPFFAVCDTPSLMDGCWTSSVSSSLPLLLKSSAICETVQPSASHCFILSTELSSTK